MKLLLIRHAEAVVLGEAGTKSDFERMLTERGTSQAMALATSLHKLDMVPGQILSSPMVRAWETASILANVLMSGTEPTRSDLLATDVRQFRKLSREVSACGKRLIVLVGHNPDLSDYAAWLIGAGDGAIDMSKASAVLITSADEPDKATGRLKWMVPPTWYLGG